MPLISNLRAIYGSAEARALGRSIDPRGEVLLDPRRARRMARRRL